MTAYSKAGPDSWFVELVPLDRMTPSNLMRTVKVVVVNRLFEAYIDGPPQWLKPNFQTFKAVTDSNKRDFLLLDGQHKCSLYKRLITWGRLPADTKVSTEFIIIPIDDFKKAQDLCMAGKSAEIVDDKILTYAVSILSGRIFRTDHTEAEQLMLLHRLLRTCNTIPWHIKIEHKALQEYLQHGWGMEKAKANQFARALLLPDSLFQLGIRLSNKLVQKRQLSTKRNTRLCTLAGYGIWQQFSARAHYSTVVLTAMIKEQLDKPVDELDAKEFSQALKTNNFIAELSRRQKKSSDDAQKPVTLADVLAGSDSSDYDYSSDEDDDNSTIS